MKAIHAIGVVCFLLLTLMSLFQWWQAESPITTLWVAAVLVFLRAFQESLEEL